MAKKALIEKNKKRIHLNEVFYERRSNLRLAIKNKSINMKDRKVLQLKLSALPIDSSKSRIRNRCSITGRPRGYYRRFGVSRIQLRSAAGWGLLPGVIKSSW